MLEGTMTISQKCFVPALDTVLTQRYTLLKYVWLLVFA